MKFDFIAIIFPHSFDSGDSSLAFSEKFPIVRAREVAFIPTMGVAGNDLFIDGIDLYSLPPVSLFSISLPLVIFCNL